jgi:8-oxo-dGTP pyrophosphatase MutT (NUDIX family)
MAMPFGLRPALCDPLCVARHPGTTLQLAGCAVWRPPGSVYLLHRSRTPAQWELPGGKIEAGESAPAAARRELLEELGLDVILERPLGEAEFVMDGVQHRYTWFLVRRWRGAARICEPETFDALEWFDGERLASRTDQLSPNVCALVQAMRSGEVTLPGINV